MSDWVPDTPYQGRQYCPGCEPEADPTREILEARWCSRHEPTRAGQDDDAVVKGDGYLSGSTEAGGDSNQAACDLIHRPTVEHRPPEEETS